MRILFSGVLLALTASSGIAQVGYIPPAAPARPPTLMMMPPVQSYPQGAAPLAPPTAVDPLDNFIAQDEDGGNGNGEGSLNPSGRFWLRGEYLLWWTKNSTLPPLVTTGLPGLTPLPGAIGQNGTSVLFGGTDEDRRPRSGGRFTVGVLLDPCTGTGLEASYFFLGSRTSQFDAASDSTLGSPLIARPFLDVLTGAQNAQLVAFPALANGTSILTPGGMGLASGNIQASTYNRFQGGDINLLCNLCSGCNYRVQSLIGVRYLRLEEGLSITESTIVNAALPATSPFFGGSTISISDQFQTRNNFYGGQVGLQGEFRRGRMFVEFKSKIALGVTNQTIDIQGSTAITPLGGTAAVTPVGFLASGSNIGHFDRSRFSVVPEVGLNAGCLLTNHLRAFVGYNFLYWSSVVRTADQIDLGLSGTQLPTDTRYNPAANSSRPAVLFRDTGFWAQGISFGAELSF